MALKRLIDRPVKVRQELDTDDDGSVLEAPQESGISGSSKSSQFDDSSNESGISGAKLMSNDNGTDTSSEDAEGEMKDEEADFQDISFGALAKAQAALGPSSKKRKLIHPTIPTEQSDGKIPNNARKLEDRDQRRKHKEHVSRSSKHAPAIQSSRHAVSRRREIFEPSPALKSRDPRFDATVLSSTRDPNAADKANKNYSFLTGYQATEILDLKSQIRKSKDPLVSAELKRQVMSLESKLHSAEAKQREKEVLQRHRREERESIKSGKKASAYYMKKSDVKREVLLDKFNNMSKKARDKAVERKRKRTKGKEARDMPRTRRDKHLPVS